MNQEKFSLIRNLEVVGILRKSYKPAFWKNLMPGDMIEVSTELASSYYAKKATIKNLRTNEEYTSTIHLVSNSLRKIEYKVL